MSQKYKGYILEISVDSITYNHNHNHGNKIIFINFLNVLYVGLFTGNYTEEKGEIYVTVPQPRCDRFYYVEKRLFHYENDDEKTKNDPLLTIINDDPLLLIVNKERRTEETDLKGMGTNH